MNHTRIHLFLLLALLLTACQGINSPSQPRIKLTDCTVYGVSAQCGKYSVYENRTAQTGRQIELNIVLLPASGNQRQADPFFYFAGGPGGVAAAYAPPFLKELSELNQERDIVLVDQRGAGGSYPLPCPPLEGAASNAANKLTAYYNACVEGLDADIRWYTTKTYVDDVYDVRQALGYDKINIAGESYGGTVVQVYLNEHPETVRTATMLRSTLLAYPILEHFADSSQRALDLVFQRCAQDLACHKAFPALKDEFSALQAQVEKGPVLTSLWDAATASRIVVTADMFSSVIHYMLMGADTAAGIPRLIHRAVVANGWEAIGKFYIQQIKPLQSIALQQGMSINILCTEPWARYQPEQVAQNSKGSYFSAAQVAQAQLFAQFCTTLPAPGPEAMYAAPRPEDAPVLVLNTNEDPQNPPANVADIAHLYPNSLVLIEPYRGHYITDWSCTRDLLTDFIQASDVKAVKPDCLQEITPIPFDVNP